MNSTHQFAPLPGNGRATAQPAPEPTLTNRWRPANPLASFRHARDGVWHTLRTQRNMRFHAAAVCVVLIAGGVLHLSLTEWLLAAGAAALVLVTEMLNTAIEAVVDIASPDYHPVAKIAKDVAAGSVLVASLYAVVVGLCLFVPPLARLTLLFLHRQFQP